MVGERVGVPVGASVGDSVVAGSRELGAPVGCRGSIAAADTLTAFRAPSTWLFVSSLKAAGRFVFVLNWLLMLANAAATVAAESAPLGLKSKTGICRFLVLLRPAAPCVAWLPERK